MKVKEVVIPAKAGVHFALALVLAAESKVKMDPSFRWDDVRDGPDVSDDLKGPKLLKPASHPQ
jgi:hypothetical protein